MNKTNSNKKTIAIVSIFVMFYLFTVFIINDVLITDNLRHKLIHIDSKVVGSRWVFYEQK